MTVLRALTDSLFDYAGMFPPAALSFEESLDRAAHFPTALHRPGLVASEMVVTPATLQDLNAPSLQTAGFDRTCRICLVGVAAKDAAPTAAAVAAFNRDRADAVVPQRIVSLELHHEDGLDEAAVAMARDTLGEAVQVYVEPRMADAVLADRLDDVLETLDRLNRDAAKPSIGFKVRCAGPTALSHRTLARVVRAVADRGVPFKATQGLHHPFAFDPRHENDHGFLNVAVALRLAQTLDLGEEELVEVLRDPEPADFVFDAGLGWRDHRVLLQRVQEAAAAVPFSIGSCSLDEPDEDLRGLYG